MPPSACPLPLKSYELSIRKEEQPPARSHSFPSEQPLCSLKVHASTGWLEHVASKTLPSMAVGEHQASPSEAPPQDRLAAHAGNPSAAPRQNCVARMPPHTSGHLPQLAIHRISPTRRTGIHPTSHYLLATSRGDRAPDSIQRQGRDGGVILVEVPGLATRVRVECVDGRCVWAVVGCVKCGSAYLSLKACRSSKLASFTALLGAEHHLRQHVKTVTLGGFHVCREADGFLF